MGKTISQAANDKANKMSDFLDNGVILLKERNKSFVNDVMLGSKTSNQVPISRFLQKKFQVRVSVTKNCDIGKEVGDVIQNFCDGKYVDAIGKIIGTVTKAILGESSGSVSEERGYFVIVGLTGAIMRLDYLVYLKSIKAKALTEVAQNFYLCSYMISSVDVKGLTYNDFASAVDLCYASLPVPQRIELISVLQKHYDGKGLLR